LTEIKCKKKKKDLLVDVVEWFIADLATNGKVDVVAISKSPVSVVAVVDDTRSSAPATSANSSSSAVVKVALGTFYGDFKLIINFSLKL
jgi:hypothetical protein